MIYWRGLLNTRCMLLNCTGILLNMLIAIMTHNCLTDDIAFTKKKLIAEDSESMKDGSSSSDEQRDAAERRGKLKSGAAEAVGDTGGNGE